MDYNIWYKGTIIANIKAASLAEAEINAKFIYGDKVAVELV